MVVGIAVGVLPAGAGAWVDALLLVAGQVLLAIAVPGALGPAVGRCPDILGQAGAGGGVVLHPAGGVGPAGGRVAGIQFLHHGLSGWWRGDLLAGNKGVALVARVAGAKGVVLVHPALGVAPAHPQAGVLTPGWLVIVFDAGQVEGAVAVDLALGLAVGRRVLVPRQAGAAAGSLELPLLTVGPTGVWLAGVKFLFNGDSGCRWVALVGRVSLIPDETVAPGAVVDDVAHGVDTTGVVSAGVDALVFLACLLLVAVGVCDALRTAGQVWVAKVVWQAPAGAGASVDPADGIVATRVGVAGVRVLDDGLHIDAASVRVALVARVAHTVGLMDEHTAPGVVAARPLAGVLAPLLQAGLVIAAL